MKELVICASCGYIMAKSGVGEKCPACGVPAKMFKPYTDPISPARRRILSLDLHPIVVHFPQGFIVFMTMLVLAAFITDGIVYEKLMATLSVLGYTLPLTVIAAFLAGILDGKTRFRRVTTPALIQKMILGIVFFLSSCGIFLTLLFVAASPAMLGLLLGMCLVGLACAVVLGLIGGRLLHSMFPG